MEKIKILTHRGLDPDKNNYRPESSREAFVDQLQRGYGLEFDIQFTEDLKMVISHLPVSNSSVTQNHNIFLDELIQLINTIQTEDAISAIHLKHSWQKEKYVDILLNGLLSLPRKKFIIFDIPPKVASYIKYKDKNIQTAPSVSHLYDIERYSGAVGNSLLSVEEAIQHRDLYDWVWLDEWDLSDKNGQEKKLNTKENFDLLKSKGFKIALVTPELHSTSPHLLGGEKHPDTETKERFEKRLEEILHLKPDAVCTDHPDLVKNLSEHI